VESSGEQHRAQRPADGGQQADGTRRVAPEPYIPEHFAFDGSGPAPGPGQSQPGQSQPGQSQPGQAHLGQAHLGPAQSGLLPPAQSQPMAPSAGYQPPSGPPSRHGQHQGPPPGQHQGPPPGQQQGVPLAPPPGARAPQPAPRTAPQPAPRTAAMPAAGMAPPPRQHMPPPPPQSAPVGLLVEDRPIADFDLHLALEYLLQTGGSDLHLSAGSPPMIRLRGELEAVPDLEALSPQAVQKVLYAILTQKQRERFEEDLELDFAYAMPGASRFRVNVYRQRESLGAAFRVIPFEIKTLDQLGINPRVSTMAALPRGMVLVTGPTGSGKSTTLAALVDEANRTRRDHIMTVEDPIEFLHKNKACLVNQREVGEDTHSFANALKHVLRQDPDIILVGEMRDLETISVALTAAETGHLVFATLHTQDAAQTIDRVIDVFPPHQQQQVRVQLASAIQGVVCQTLCKTADGRGRAAATEVMFATGAIRNLIREGKTHQIYSAMQAGAKHGMQTMDQNLAELVKARTITFEHGLEKCHHLEDFKRLTGHA
jgi:twitching motility protein PilT